MLTGDEVGYFGATKLKLLPLLTLYNEMLRIDALLKQFMADQLEAEPTAQGVTGLLLSVKVLP